MGRCVWVGDRESVRRREREFVCQRKRERQRESVKRRERGV